MISGRVLGRLYGGSNVKQRRATEHNHVVYIDHLLYLETACRLSYRYPRPVPFANSLTVLLSRRYCSGLEWGTLANALTLLRASSGDRGCEEI